MRFYHRLGSVAVAAFLALTSFGSLQAQVITASEGRQEGRQVSITIDDLPVVSLDTTEAARTEITQKILGHLTAARAPAVGFVVGSRLLSVGAEDVRQLSLLRLWLQAGCELGNHSYSHRSLNRIPLEEYMADVLRADSLLRPFLQRERQPLRYYRHPFLQTGRSVAVRDSFTHFVQGLGYRVAPVTIDNSDWIFARAFDRAYLRRDTAMTRRIVDAYVAYMEAKCAFYEGQSRKLFGREIPQVLLIHSSRLNAESLDRLLGMMQNRGYRFIPLTEALKDSAYDSPDTFTGGGGISWLDRWALTAGKPRTTFFRGDPPTPAWVMKEAGVEEE